MIAAATDTLAPEDVHVRTSLTGVPLRVAWAGREWRIVAEPLWWWEQRRWWRDRPAGGPIVPEVLVWRIDVVPARATRAEPRTLWLHRLGDRWSVERHQP